MRKCLLLFTAMIPTWLFPNTSVIKKLQIEAGLSNNYIQGITQDRQGFIWVGTESGLNRFDGHEFKTFYHLDNNPNSISSNQLNDIYADKNQDIIWIATERIGLCGYNYSTNQFVFYKNSRNPDCLSSNGVMFLSGEASGNLWVTTYQTGIDLLDMKTKHFIHYNQSTVKGLASNFSRCAIDDKHGNLYIGHLFSGLSVVSIKNKTAVNYMPNPQDPNSLPGNEVFNLFIDSKKRIWVGTDNGLALFHPEKKMFTVYKKNNNPGSLSSNFITSIQEVNDQIWIGTTAGINILEEQFGLITTPDKVVFRHISASDARNGLSHPHINNIFQDQYKNIWIGTLGGGVNFLGNITGYFKTIVHSLTTKGADNLSNRCVQALCFDANNQLWIGTEGGGVDVFDNGVKIRNYSMENKSIPDNRITSVFKDSQNNMWLGTLEGSVLFYNVSNNQFSRLKEFSVAGNIVRGFYEDNYKNLWIATEKGLYSLNLNSGLKRMFTNENSQLATPIVRTISGDKMGRIWVGSLGGGLQIFTADFQLIRSFSPGMFYEVTHVLRDSKNRMWVATRQNLFLFNSCNDTIYTTYGLKEGLADNFIRAIAEGVNDDIWISTNRGLSCLNARTGLIQNFNKHDGIPIGNFMSGAVTKSPNGTIYFGSENGICYFNSNESLPTYDLPPVVITDFSIVNKQSTNTDNLSEVPITDKIDLDYNQNTFSLSFNVLDYSLNDMVEFSYQMKGLDESWYDVNDDKILTFRNLQSGRYLLSVKTRLRNQNWSEKVTTLQLYIHPPFWFSWWAKLIYTILILFVTLYIIRFYKKKVVLENTLLFEKKAHQQEQELNEERLRFYTNITHELRTPLTLIIGPLEDIATDQTVEPSIAKKINLIHRSANRLLGLINQILEFRKSETMNRRLNVMKGNIGNLVQEIGLRYKELNQNPNVEINIKLPTYDNEMYFDPEIVTIILDNLLSNALKYTPQGEVSLSLLQTKDGDKAITEIVVSDTGYGISKDALPNIFNRYYQVKGEHQMSGTGIGLSLVKNMVELHEGNIQVESSLNKGTTFTFTISTENNYPSATRILINNNEDTKIEKIQGSTQLILVVEDNEEIRQYIRDCFPIPYEVIMAEDGKKGLELAMERTPDIIISDIMMPIMDGMELCKLIKEDVNTSHIPVILLTAKDSIQSKTEGYNIGADSYITKPFSAKLLQSRVSNLLDARKKIISLFNKPNAQKQALLKDSLNQLDNEFIEKLTRIIESNIETEQIAIAQIADQMNMGHSTLYRKLKALTGLSITEFIQKIRMSTAEKILLTGKYSIAEIVFMVGLNSVNYFRECFKAEFGVTPKEYMRNIREGNN